MVVALQYISIVIEAIITILALMILFKKKKQYGLCFAITFGIYVFYDLARLMVWNISPTVLYLSFFIASVSALWGMWELYTKK
jgi:ABC-type transport system involved in Fe-S cluster assembly fused permease/ATPase subunit